MAYTTLDQPPEFKGFAGLRGFLKRLRKFSIESQIKSVVQSGVKKPQILQTPSGLILKLPKGGTGGTSSPRVFPFQLIDASIADGDPGGPLAQIRVRYGLVNDGTTGDDWLPTGMAAGDDPPLIIDVSSVGASGTIYLHIETDSSTLEVTAVTPETDATTPSSTTNDAYKELGSFTVADDVVASIAQPVQTSLGYVNANGVHVYWQV